jgi:exopolysaccharide biosynthesis polyprenyl glycosylphosphotransferase
MVVFVADLFWFFISSLAVLLNSGAGTEGEARVFAMVAVLVGIYISSLYLMDIYELDLIREPKEFGFNLLLALGLASVAAAVAQKLGILPLALPLVLQLTLTVVFILAARAAIAAYFRHQRGAMRIGFIGGAEAKAELEKRRRALDVLGITIEPLAEHLRQATAWFSSALPLHGIRYIVVDDDRFNSPMALGFLENCAHAGIGVVCLSTFCERAFGRVSLASHLVRELGFPATGLSKVLRDATRRVRDILIGSLALAISSPIWLIIAIAIKFDAPGPVFFAQERVGRNGRRFTMLKFRSMRSDIKILRGPHWTTQERDPRVTRVGAMIRLLHLDELPQLINVIRGDMSIVGPRPFHPSHSAQLEAAPFFKLRLTVPPGITGWAQIRCDYSDSVSSHEEVLARDLFYLKHAGLLFDLLVIVDTLRVCIWRRGSR